MRLVVPIRKDIHRSSLFPLYTLCYRLNVRNHLLCAFCASQSDNLNVKYCEVRESRF